MSSQQSAWQAMLAEYAAEVENEQHKNSNKGGGGDSTHRHSSSSSSSASFRVVVVGDCGAGKRTFVSRLMDPGMRRKIPQPNGAGVGYTVHEVRKSDGSLSLVELVTLDSKDLLSIVFPTKHSLENTFLVYLVDAAATSTSLSSCQGWQESVRDHICSNLLTTPEERNRFAAARVKEWSLYSDVLADTRTVHLEAAASANNSSSNNTAVLDQKNSAAAAESFGMHQDDAALLPSMVIVNKFDLFEKQQKISNVKVGDMSALQFFQQVLRKVAVSSRSGFAMMSAKHPASSVTSLSHGLWEYICGHLGLELHQEGGGAAGTMTTATASGGGGSTNITDAKNKKDEEEEPALDATVGALNATTSGGGSALGGGNEKKNGKENAAAAAAAKKATAFITNNNAVEDVISMEVSQNCFLPRGFDALGNLSPQILAEMHSFSAVFRKVEPSVPVIVKHEEIVKGMKFSSASAAESEPLAWDE